jgi:hypothetical protein
LKFPEQIIPKTHTNDPPNSGHPHKTTTATPKKVLFCSTLSEFENFLLCERILINVTTLVKTKRQANFKDFKRFGAFKGLVEEKNVVNVCKLGLFWHEWASFHSRFKGPRTH